MCVICYKRKSVPLPTEATIRKMWEYNPDGAGVMWNNGGKVFYKKGFMQLEEFLVWYRANRTILANKEAALHFRLASHGGITPGNTHPYPISQAADIHALEGSVDLAIMHNGQLPLKPRATDISDSAELALRASAFEDPVLYLASIDEFIGTGNRALVFARNTVHFCGNRRWQQDSTGLLYSNLIHEAVCVKD